MDDASNRSDLDPKTLNEKIDSALHEFTSSHLKKDIRIKRIQLCQENGSHIELEKTYQNFMNQAFNCTNHKISFQNGDDPIFLQVEQRKQDTWSISSTVQFSFGYSTWKGRVMNLNSFLIQKEVEQDLQYCIIDGLKKIAQALLCARIVFQSTNKGELDFWINEIQAEDLPDWLTLEMNQDAMQRFTNTNIDEALSIPQDDVKTIQMILKQRNVILSTSDHTQATLYLAEQTDADSIFELVNGLAIYEKAQDEVAVTSAINQRDGCLVNNAIFHCILVNIHKDDKEVVVGMGFFYFGYDIENGGRYLYLEDLFIKEEYRGKGHGKTVMTSLAEIALKCNCSRFVWQALDWNTPALNFYEKIGAKICNDLRTVRLNESDISS